MRLPLVTVLADEPRQVQVPRRERHADLLARFAAGADVGRFAPVHFQLAAAGAPEAAVGFLGTFEQKHFLRFAENVQQGGDFIRQGHGDSGGEFSARLPGRSFVWSARSYPPYSKARPRLAQAESEVGPQWR